MARKVIHVALNGVTGRMGYRQRLVRSLLASREQGGIALDDGNVLYPEPVLVGRRRMSVFTRLSLNQATVKRLSVADAAAASARGACSAGRRGGTRGRCDAECPASGLRGKRPAGGSIIARPIAGGGDSNGTTCLWAAG